jgi:hypothetical protein
MPKLYFIQTLFTFLVCSLSVLNAQSCKICSNRFSSSSSTASFVSSSTGARNSSLCFQLPQNLQNLSILAYSGITNTGLSFFTGDVDTATSTYTAGGATVIGQIHVADQVALNAQTTLALTIATLQAFTATRDLSGTDLGGLVLTSGVYSFSGSAGLTGTLTLNGPGTYIFQIVSTLITATNAAVVLTNGAAPCNVYWVVGSSVTLAGPTTFFGTILASTSIGQTGAAGTTVTGRLLANTAAITFAAATNVNISEAICNCPGASSSSTAAFPWSSSSSSSFPSSSSSSGANANNATCYTNGCLNNATCNNSTGTPICKCAFGFNGAVCQNTTNFCTTTPCMNGGSCTNNITNPPTGYTCNCILFWSGQNCTTSSASHVQCLFVTAALLLLSLLGLLV